MNVNKKTFLFQPKSSAVPRLSLRTTYGNCESLRNLRSHIVCYPQQNCRMELEVIRIKSVFLYLAVIYELGKLVRNFK